MDYLLVGFSGVLACLFGSFARESIFGLRLLKFGASGFLLQLSGYSTGRGVWFVVTCSWCLVRGVLQTMRGSVNRCFVCKSSFVDTLHGPVNSLDRSTFSGSFVAGSSWWTRSGASSPSRSSPPNSSRSSPKPFLGLCVLGWTQNGRILYQKDISIVSQAPRSLMLRRSSPPNSSRSSPKPFWGLCVLGWTQNGRISYQKDISIVSQAPRSLVRGRLSPPLSSRSPQNRVWRFVYWGES